MNEIIFCVPTLMNFGLLGNCFGSAISGTVPPTKISLICNGGICPPLRRTPVPMDVHIPTRNLGVATSWNYFLRKYEDYIIIANDDVVLLPNTIQKLVEAANSNNEEVFFCTENISAFSLFLQKRLSTGLIGYYDEKFYPAYFEDNDYEIRLRNIGRKIVKVQGCIAKHLGGGSIAYTSRPEVDAMIQNNKKYFFEKWPNEKRL